MHGIALNIRADEGREIIYELVKDADVFMSSLATSASLKKYGID